MIDYLSYLVAKLFNVVFIHYRFGERGVHQMADNHGKHLVDKQLIRTSPVPTACP
jgi:hypothetical protein